MLPKEVEAFFKCWYDMKFDPTNAAVLDDFDSAAERLVAFCADKGQVTDRRELMQSLRQQFVIWQKNNKLPPPPKPR